ncbi:hypothetical protein XSR1_230045 [Xenorhabdus szentirmaii DSM 16338]|uniref:Uncharacterized protein n=1 Tax=Xenorhabdus szentirmaii DSM 16338 TaxID=1427518 RepID=W1IW60_9GAMM|nr:hypothetical protein XSR1_230045 [Xenorhabdus szentirmaii DSM 16338]
MYRHTLKNKNVIIQKNKNTIINKQIKINTLWLCQLKIKITSTPLCLLLAIFALNS